ncbi:hypothetical protein ACIQFP_10505 [Nocardiopsis alba]|uniref:hypothetical protein n=1 Tax=Nocardiopsis alba TaxID=53437 RepID=UPI00381A91DB
MTSDAVRLRDVTRLARSAAHLGGRDTALAKQLARELFRLRLEHTRPDGTPDLAGRSRAYKDAVSQVYDATGLDQADRKSLQQRVQYHLSTCVHEYMAEHGIDPADYGLNPRSRKESLAASVRARRAGVEVSADDPTETLIACLTTAGSALASAMEPAHLAAIEGLSERDRARAREVLDVIADAEAVLRSYL